MISCIVTRRVLALSSRNLTLRDLTGLVQSETAKIASRKGFKIAAGGGATIVGTGGNASLAFEKAPSDEGAETLQRAYDPLWANARELLDALYEKELILDIERANLGQFVLVSGEMSIIDTSLLKSIFEKPVLRSHMLRLNNIPEAPKHGRRSERDAIPSSMEVGFELITVFTLTAQAIISSGNTMTWATLIPSCLTVKSGDLLLQHGVTIPGKWHMLALLDSKPDLNSESYPPDPRLSPLATGLAGMLPQMRAILGRPAGAYGATPLLIFREVAP